MFSGEQDESNCFDINAGSGGTGRKTGRKCSFVCTAATANAKHPKVEVLEESDGCRRSRVDHHW